METKIIIFKEDYKCIIAGISEVVGSNIGEPDCELTNAYEFVEMDDDGGDYKNRLRKWEVLNKTSQNKCRIQSDTILTLVDPEDFILKAYKELTGI